MSSVCHSYVLVCLSYVTHMYLYVIHISFVCTHMSSVCHSYVIRISLVCTRTSSVCHLYVLVCHPYATRMHSYVIRMSLVCGFTMNHSWDIYQEKLATKFSKVTWWALWIGHPRNFCNSLFVKNYYLNLTFFQALQSAVLKNEIKNFLKEDASHLKIAWQLT